LIDLSYNSSRLEGNTYSRLDTQKLVEEGIAATGKVHEETVMIMNHKEAILFLVENAQEFEINNMTIRNLHHLLSQDLLHNPEACGNIRAIEVNIGPAIPGVLSILMAEAVGRVPAITQPRQLRARYPVEF